MPKIASTSGRGGRLHELARVGVQRFEVAPLALVEQDVEGERATCREPETPVITVNLLARDLDVDVLQVVLARVVDRRIRRSRVGRARRRPPVCGDRAAAALPAPIGASACVVGARAPGRCASVAWRARCRGVPATTTSPPRVAALGAEIDDPVGGADHVEVVLDDEQRVAGVEQLAGTRAAAWRCPRSAGRWSARRTGTACRGALVLESTEPRFGQVAGELQALRLAAGERRHRLAELHVLEAHVGERLQARGDLRRVARRTRSASVTVRSSTSAMLRRAAGRAVATCISSISAR